jgi:putative redox protein
MDVKVSWQKGLSFIGTADSGFQVPLGTDPQVGGADDGFRPMELMALSLAGCTGMDVASILAKKRQEMTHFEVRVHADKADEHPKVFTRAIIEYIVTGRGIDESAVYRAIELSATKYCPAQAMLGKVIPLELKYQIHEMGENGETRLVKKGNYPIPTA